MRVTFIHESKSADGPDITLIPIGLVGLADYIAKQENKVEILHHKSEQVINPEFNLSEYLKQQQTDAVCLDLHWHLQAADVINTIKELKANNPTLITILGGLTASFFAEEIITNHQEKSPLEQVPNLTWRINKKTITNPQTFTIKEEMINKLNFTNFDLIKNKEFYLRLQPSEEKCLNCKKECDKKSFYFTVGRGCPVDCSFCGGSKTSQKLINNRDTPINLDPKKAVEELKKAKENHGLDIWYACYDPFPRSKSYLEIFKEIRKQKIDLGLRFESWALPTTEFIDEFKKTFDPTKSEIILSPESGSEKVRQKNKGYNYSNTELLETLEYIESKGLRSCVYFTTGLPFEKKEDALKSLALINFIRTNFNKTKILTAAIIMEPGSPWFLDPEKYGIKTKLKTFSDYLNFHAGGFSVGYETEHMKELEIRDFIGLMDAEEKCVYPESNFLKTLLKTCFSIEHHKTDQLHALCSTCKNYRECFPSLFIK